MKVSAKLLAPLLLSLPITAQSLSTSASAVAYGASCGGMTLTATLPIIGGTTDLTTTGVPVGALTVTGLALARTLTPGPLLFLPWDPLTCRLHVIAPTPYLTQPYGATTTTFTLAIPNNSGLKGMIVYAQSYGVFTVPFWLSSNGIEFTVGI